MPPARGGRPIEDVTAELRADCANCFALCCVVPAFSASADFAFDKPAGEPCPHLREDFRCGIHDRLPAEGFPGCVLYDCSGAGQKVSQVTFGGHDWRQEPDLAPRMFAAFGVMRELHDLLWAVSNVLGLPPAEPVRAELEAARARTDRITRLPAGELLALDLAAHRGEVGALLQRVGELVRADVLGAFATGPGEPPTRLGVPELARRTGLPAASLVPVLTRLERAGSLVRTGDRWRAARGKPARSPGPAH